MLHSSFLQIGLPHEALQRSSKLHPQQSPKKTTKSLGKPSKPVALSPLRPESAFKTSSSVHEFSNPSVSPGSFLSKESPLKFGSLPSDHQENFKCSIRSLFNFEFLYWPDTISLVSVQLVSPLMCIFHSMEKPCISVSLLLPHFT